MKKTKDIPPKKKKTPSPLLLLAEIAMGVAMTQTEQNNQLSKVMNGTTLAGTI